MIKKGLVQIYTGKGKGKTTAAIGLAVRAAGYGNKVLIYQFLKPAKMESGERKLIESKIKQIKIEAPDADWKIGKANEKAAAKMRAVIKEALDRIALMARNKDYDCIILDEIVYCIYEGLADIKEVKKIIEMKDKSVELVLTGRGAGKELISLADLVTEMKEIKHPFEKGIKAREGIEY